MATLFKSVPESSRMKTPLQEHNNGLQFFPSADGERPVTARAARSWMSDIPIYCHQRLPKSAPRWRSEVEMPKLSIDWRERFRSMKMSDGIVPKSLEIRKKKTHKSVPPEDPMRHPCNAVLLVRPLQTDTTGVNWGGTDWWLQLSQRRRTQADSWPPVAPDATVMEACGIVFHSRGQSAAQGSGHCSSQPGKQARGPEQSSRKEFLCK